MSRNQMQCQFGTFDFAIVSRTNDEILGREGQKFDKR